MLVIASVASHVMLRYSDHHAEEGAGPLTVTPGRDSVLPESSATLSQIRVMFVGGERRCCRWQGTRYFSAAKLSAAIDAQFRVALLRPRMQLSQRVHLN